MTSEHFGFSKIPLNPSFRDSAVNSVAVVPLLSQNGENATTRSSGSFLDLMTALDRHSCTSKVAGDLLLVVPNSTLTRPGDWRYSDTPLKAFHWQNGCQRLKIFDGRPQVGRHAHDKLLQSSNRDWIDLIPSRRTAAVIGVLNMHDCKSENDLKVATEELRQWASRYATPPYEVTAQGGIFERDSPVQRLFVYDSFDEENQHMDLSQTNMGNNILAFPPTDDAHQQMMDLHLNVVISDLTVAIFRDLETKIKESADATSAALEAAQPQSGFARTAISRYISGTSSAADSSQEEPKVSRTLGVSQMAGLVSPDSKLAKESANKEEAGSENTATVSQASTETTSSKADISMPSNLPKLMTPLDEQSPVDLSAMTAKDVEAIKRRDVARRIKRVADLCLLAGSPIDAYERYLKAAEVCKAGALDPLWHASALEGCAAAHIAMAEAGGHGYVAPELLLTPNCSVDEYLENNFQLPEDIMALVKDEMTKRTTTSTNKQTLPEVVLALCDEALNIVSRSDQLGHLYAELLLKLAGYCAVESESHLRCRWGEGLACYQGELGDQPRWSRTSVSKMAFNELKTKDDADMVAFNSLVRVKFVSELLNRAVTVGCLDAATRVDVALRSVRLCLSGVKVRIVQHVRVAH